MAPLTFPNEKQMVSSEESGPAVGWGGGCCRLGSWGAARGAWGGLLPHVRDRREGKQPQVFSAFFFFSFDAGWVGRLSSLKCGVRFSPGNRGVRSAEAGGTGPGGMGAKRPPGPAPSASPGGDTRTWHGRRPGPVCLFPGRGLPHTPLPPAPPLWGNFPTKGRRERCVSGLEISCRSAAGKQKDFTEQKTAGGDLMLPSIFLNEITPN